MKIGSWLNRNRAITLFSLFAISFILRASITFQKFSNNGIEKWTDSLLYVKDGMDFFRGDFYPQNSRHGFMIEGPTIPLVIAASKYVTGNPVIPILVINCLLGSLLVYVLFAMGKLIMSPRLGYILAIWSVFNYNLIRFCSQTYKEPFNFFLFPLVILLLLNVIKNKQVILNTVLSSLVFSLLIHTDERFFAYSVVFIAIFVFFVTSKNRLKLLSLWAGVLVLTMIPWTIRNYNQFGQVVLLTPRTTVFTSALWGKTFAEPHFSTKESIDETIDLYLEGARSRGLVSSQVKIYGKYERYLYAFYHYWKPTYFKITYIQYGTRAIRWSLSHNTISILFYGIFLPLYIMGMILAIAKRHWLMTLLGAIPIYHSIVHTVMIWPLERYRLPADFLVVLVAVWALVQIRLLMASTRNSAAEMS